MAIDYFYEKQSGRTHQYAANSFLALRSASSRTRQLADAVGADIDEVKRGFTSDSRIQSGVLYPGVGYGGVGFPKDVEGPG